MEDLAFTIFLYLFVIQILLIRIVLPVTFVVVGAFEKIIYKKTYGLVMLIIGSIALFASLCLFNYVHFTNPC